MRAVIFRYPTEFPADDIERRVPDAATARELVRERNPQLLELLAHRRERFAPLIAARTDHPPVAGAEDAVLMAFCRLAFRHGSWGDDFHAYHNEGHIFEILGPRLERLIAAIGITSLSLRDWFLLALFAAAHDLRQREVPQFAAGTGSNERASIEETFRILHACGFSRERNAEVFTSIELMIAGSTFDARPAMPAAEFNSAELVVESGGALAQKLDTKLDKHAPGWRADTNVVHALELALVAADLDTANVAEDFPLLMASAERLCLEREMRSHRDPASAASAQPMLDFLTTGQEHYFFDLHRFSSAQGRAAFAAAKLANVQPMRALVRDLRAALPAPRTGNEVLAAFHALANKAR
ncbi:MAG: hypothetical protein JSR27_11885 [Proteobacteria bacterium]|nr:hypothetical protein [Pseudomonadota bacterium]